MNTKIFCDIAELDLIKKFNKKKIVKGFTTNPSLMRKAGAKSYKSYSEKILKICNNKPVSLEVFADEYYDSEEYYEEPTFVDKAENSVIIKKLKEEFKEVASTSKAISLSWCLCLILYVFQVQ